MIPALYSVKEPSNLMPLLHEDLLALVEEVGEHAALAIEVGGVPLVIDSASNSFNPFQLSLGAGRMDGTVSTAQGKIMLAYKSRRERELILSSPHMRRRIGTILNLDELEAELDRIAKEGIAFDYEEHWVGLCGISVPVWDGSNSLAAAVSCLTASEKFTDERRLRLAAALKACAARMSSKLGAVGQTVNGEVPQGEAPTASATA
jgi:DNA-binding IclR family transcriptional regulator